MRVSEQRGGLRLLRLCQWWASLLCEAACPLPRCPPRCCFLLRQRTLVSGTAAGCSAATALVLAHAWPPACRPAAVEHRVCWWRHDGARGLHFHPAGRPGRHACLLLPDGEGPPSPAWHAALELCRRCAAGFSRLAAVRFRLAARVAASCTTTHHPCRPGWHQLARRGCHLTLQVLGKRHGLLTPARLGLPLESEADQVGGCLRTLAAMCLWAGRQRRHTWRPCASCRRHAAPAVPRWCPLASSRVRAVHALKMRYSVRCPSHRRATPSLVP